MLAVEVLLAMSVIGMTLIGVGWLGLRRYGEGSVLPVIGSVIVALGFAVMFGLGGVRRPVIAGIFIADGWRAVDAWSAARGPVRTAREEPPRPRGSCSR